MSLLNCEEAKLLLQDATVTASSVCVKCEVDPFV